MEAPLKNGLRFLFDSDTRVNHSFFSIFSAIFRAKIRQIFGVGPQVEPWDEVKVVNYTRFWHLEGGAWLDVALRYDFLPILKGDK